MVPSIAVRGDFGSPVDRAMRVVNTSMGRKIITPRSSLILELHGHVSPTT